MTAVKQLLKELQEKFPKQMADMYDSNQLLLEDIALKAKEMEKQEKIELLKSLVYSVCIGDDVEDVEEWLKEHELNKSE